jgi:predicted dehydrogenase
VGLFSNLGKAIREGAPLAVKWNEATAVVEMIELIYRSSKEGRTVDVPATLLN